MPGWLKTPCGTPHLPSVFVSDSALKSCTYYPVCSYQRTGRLRLVSNRTTRLPGFWGRVSPCENGSLLLASYFALSSPVGLIGLEPMTLRLSSACSNQLSYRPVRVWLPAPADRKEIGGKGIRTPDIQLAKLALYQLSYAPVFLTRAGGGRLALT